MTMVCFSMSLAAYRPSPCKRQKRERKGMYTYLSYHFNFPDNKRIISFPTKATS